MSGCMHAMQFRLIWNKTAQLKVENLAQQLLGSLQLDFAHPALAYYVTCLLWICNVFIVPVSGSNLIKLFWHKLHRFWSNFSQNAKLSWCKLHRKKGFRIRRWWQGDKTFFLVILILYLLVRPEPFLSRETFKSYSYRKHQAWLKSFFEAQTI